MVGHNYNCLEQYLMQGYVNWNTSSAGYNPSNAIYVALLTASYVPSALHKVWADVSAFESTATGYTAGGEAVSLSNTYTQSAAVTSVLASNASASQKNVVLTSSSGFVPGDVVLVSNGAGTTSELAVISSISSPTLTMVSNLANAYTTAGSAYCSQYPLYTNFSLSTNPTWTISAGTLSTAYAVYYINATVNSIVKPLLTYQDFGGTTTMSSGTFTITENGGVVIERLSD